MTENTQAITIWDPEYNNEYTVELNKDDYVKATTDETFVSALLFHARCNNNVAKKNTTAIEQPLHQDETFTDDEEVEVEHDDYSQTNVNLEGSTKVIRMWGYDEVIALINSMGNHIEDLNHPKKRKHVYEHVANDLISAGYNVNSLMVQNKWKSLIKSYRKAKDNKTRTGKAVSRFLFFNVIDDLLGTQPTNSCSHSLNSEDSITDNRDLDNIQEEPDVNATNIDNSIDAGERPETATSNDSSDSKSYNRLSAKRFRLNYVNTKQEEYNKRENRHKERMELEKEKLGIEKKKVELLEEYLNYLKNKN